jgi:hypothetical protein
LPSAKENAAPEKKSFRSFLRHPFKKPSPVQTAELKRPRCRKEPCAVCPPGESRHGKGGCVSSVVASDCQPGQFWNGFACGTRYRVNDCSALAAQLAQHKRQMRSAMTAQQQSCSYDSASQECDGLRGQSGGESLRHRQLQEQYDQCVALERAALDAGVQIPVPFTPGRRDTTQELTDIEMFDWLKPVVDGFRNYVGDQFAEMAPGVAPEEMFLDKAQLLALTAPEWVALVGGLRAMGANYDGSANGIFTDRVGVLTNDFFTVLTSMDYEWKKQDEKGMMFSLDDRATGKPRFKATRSDLIFGSNSQLRAVAEVYASSDGHTRFVKDFVQVWDKVMMLDRFDVRS